MTQPTNYPPGVTGHEPQITGDNPNDWLDDIGMADHIEQTDAEQDRIRAYAEAEDQYLADMERQAYELWMDALIDGFADWCDDEDRDATFDAWCDYVEHREDETVAEAERRADGDY